MQNPEPTPEPGQAENGPMAESDNAKEFGPAAEADDNTSPENKTSPASKSLDPRLTEVREHIPLSTFFHSLWAAIALSGVSLPLIYLVGGAGQFWKAANACGLSIMATILGMVVLLRPVDALNFVGMVYFSVLIRMGLGLGSVFIMRQIDTPLYGSDWVGYLVFFYSSILLAETVLVVNQLNSAQRSQRQNGSAKPDTNH